MLQVDDEVATVTGIVVGLVGVMLYVLEYDIEKNDPVTAVVKDGHDFSSSVYMRMTCRDSVGESRNTARFVEICNGSIDRQHEPYSRVLFVLIITIRTACASSGTCI